MIVSKKSNKPERSGLVVVDKPLGVTSHDVVAAMRGALHMRRVGHAGTLDPQASGVLVIGFGYGTRLLNYIVDHTKSYEATIRLGQASTTDDSEGEIRTVAPSVLADDELQSTTGDERNKNGNVRTLTLQEIEQVISDHLTGDIQQVPSSYSAVRVNGRHAYELARQGKDIELDARPVTINEFTVLHAYNAVAGVDGGDPGNGARTIPVIDVDVRVGCSTGTYIRSLGRDLGQLLGVGGYLTKLRRTRVGKFDLEDSQLAGRVVTAHADPRTFTNREGATMTLNRVVLDIEAEELTNRSLTMLEAVQRTMPVIAVSDEDASNLRFGRRLPISLPVETNSDCSIEVGEEGDGDGIAAAYQSQTGEVVGIVQSAGAHELKPVVVFPR
jgi:tRNA pseudouridine55 synthase